MEYPLIEANSDSSPPDSKKVKSLGEQLAQGLIPCAVSGTHQLFRLPGGRHIVLNAHRQAKKLIRATEGLSPRQYRKRRKELMREARQTNVAADAG